MNTKPGSQTEAGVANLGDNHVYFEKTGSGPTLLFVHGWPLNGQTWRNVTPHLDGFTRIVIDLPGNGSSAVTPQTDLSVRGHAAVVISFIEELGLTDVVLVGQDSGGMICRFAAELRPDLIAGLSLCGTEIPGVHAPIVKMFKQLAFLPGAKAMFRLTMGNKFIARTPLVLGGTVFDTAFLDGEFRTNVLTPILADDDAMDNALEMIRHFSLDDIDALAATHANLEMPVLLVWGAQDPFFPVAKARQMIGQFGGVVDFETISEAKLLVHEEHPQRFAELTRAFVERRCHFATRD